MTYIVPSKANIRNIKDIHADLLTYIKNNDEIKVDLDGCEENDLSLVQLIESGRKTAEAAGKPISLANPVSDSIKNTLDRAGLFEAFSKDDLKFWLHKEVL
jgi:anti-anti-sigma regulatory factor